MLTPASKVIFPEEIVALGGLRCFKIIETGCFLPKVLDNPGKNDSKLEVVMICISFGVFGSIFKSKSPLSNIA